MGRKWKDGYSATIESYIIAGRSKYRLATTNDQVLTLVDDCTLSPGTEATMTIIIDGDASHQQVRFPDGILPGTRRARYEVVAPF